MVSKRAKVSVSQAVRDSLHMVHNPFANTTQQPRIPDGKIGQSLGLSTQSIYELHNPVGSEMIHLLLFAGQNASVVALGAGSDTLNRNYRVYGYPSAQGLDYSIFKTATTPRRVYDQSDNSIWRAVSIGLQLKLMNAQDQNDGWWEAIRVTPKIESSHYYLTSLYPDVEDDDDGTLAPVALLAGQLANLGQMSNEGSYCTGLLRDINSVQFELHGRQNDHDFIIKREGFTLGEDDYLNVPASFHVLPTSGAESIVEMAESTIDQSYDMIYIRLHLRSHLEASDTYAGSKLHMNMVLNTEQGYDEFSNEKKFETKSESVGADLMSLHLQGRRETSAAATLIG